LKTARIVIRSLRYYWATGLVVAFGVAVATAVIVGSLVVGDSITGSLRDTALERLGRVTHALIAPRFFDADLADRLAGQADRVGAHILLEGSVRNPDTGAASPRVQVIAGDARFFAGRNHPPNLSGRSVEINQALAEDLGLKAGAAILLSIGKRGQAPADTLFGRREREYTLQTLRLTVAAVVREGGDFSLVPGSTTPRNLFISREWLAEQIGQSGKANALLADTEDVTRLQTALETTGTPSDHGLKAVLDDTHRILSIQSTQLLLSNRHVAIIQSTAKQLGTTAHRTSVYLADMLQRGETKTHYAIICGFEPLSLLKLKHGWVPEAGYEFIVLNTWSADDLKAKPGDSIELAYRVATPGGDYVTRSKTLTMQATVELTWPAWDTTLVPDFEGITNVDKLSDWEPPFPIDRKLITERDDAYWHKYRTSPKAFLPLEALRRIWADGGSSEWVTSVRVPVPEDTDLIVFTRHFLSELVRGVDPADSGLVFRPVREEAIEAASGSTPFGVLFLSMGMFLVASGVGLAGMLMRLSIERRSNQMGMLLACGFDSRRAANLMAAEGAVLAVAGVAIGAPAGIAYASGIIYALQTWWSGAVGQTAALWLHVTPAAVLGGVLGGLAAGLLSIGLAVRHLRRQNVLALLSGWQSLGVRLPSRKAVLTSWTILLLCLAGAAGLWLASSQVGLADPTGAFFGIGVFLLVGGLTILYQWLATTLKRRRPAVSLIRLALRYAAGHRGRSLLAAGLIACSAFVIVAVAANERDFSHVDSTAPTSGTGGFTLRAESALPVHYDFGTPSGREALGFSPEDEPLWEGVNVYSFLLGGDGDISCLNLATTKTPRVIGASPAFIKRGGFTVQPLNPGSAANPWTALEGKADDDPRVFGDSQSVMWQLQSGLGKSITLRGEAGTPFAARFTGLVSSSILAGELIVSQDNFKTMFPSQSAPRFFLIETPPDKADAVAASLRRNLGEMGLSVRSTLEMNSSAYKTLT